MKAHTAKHAHLYTQLTWADVCPKSLRALLETAKAEDLNGHGLAPTSPHIAQAQALLGRCVTTQLLPGSAGSRMLSARVVARQPLVACGLGVIAATLNMYAAGAAEKEGAEKMHVQVCVGEGAHVEAGTPLANITAPAETLLLAERVLLNTLQHMCGIATFTAQHVKILEGAFSGSSAGSAPKLLCTRKTRPGLRALEKYAVAQGGGFNHRYGLFARVMLKDNHFAATPAEAFTHLQARVHAFKAANPACAVEVEVDSSAHLAQAVELAPDVVLLDNFSTADMQAACAQLALAPGGILTEASGNITAGRLPELANIGLHFISSGALIHQAPWVDIGLDA